MKHFSLTVVMLLSLRAQAQDAQLEHCNQDLPKLAKEEKTLLAKLDQIDKVARDDFKKFQSTKNALKGGKAELDRLSQQPDAEGNNYDLVFNGYIVKGYEAEMSPDERGSVPDNIKEYKEDKIIAGKFAAASRGGNFARDGAKVAEENKAPNFFRSLQDSADVGADAEMHIDTNRIGTTAHGARLAGRAQKNTYLGNLERGRWKLEDSRKAFEPMLNRASVKTSSLRNQFVALLNHYRLAERAVQEGIRAFQDLGPIHRSKAVCMRAIKRAGQNVEDRMKSLGH